MSQKYCEFYWICSKNDEIKCLFENYGKHSKTCEKWDEFFRATEDID